jgi:hypothetical protein
LFDSGLNDIGGTTQQEPPLPTVSPQVSNQTSVESPATHPVVQVSTQNSTSPALKNILVVAQEVTQTPVAKPDLAGNLQQPESVPNTSIASVHAQHPVTEGGKNFSERANQVRDCDLETVAIDLGLERDRHDKHKWHGSGQIISINGGKFYDHLNQKGSGGAIDLVMHVQDCDYKQAVDWLSEQPATSFVPGDHFPVKVHEPVAKDEPKYLALPVKDETKWSDVRQYLVETRGLPERLIDHAHQLGLIYADSQHNAVFPRYAANGWERGEMTGASLRGTRGDFRGLSPGSQKDKGWFWFGLGKGEVQRVVLVESAIDALSFAALDKSNYKENKTVYLSADGAGAIPIKDLQAVIERGGQVIVGYDADRAGEQMAWKVAQSLPRVTRLQPNCGKDWNEQLLGNNKSSLSVDSPEEWSRIAKALGKPESYINRVTDVVTAFKAGQPLSEKATTAMHCDRDTYKQSLDSLWNWHSTANTLGKSSQYLSRISEVALAFNADKPSPLSAEAVATMQRDRNVHQVVDTSQKVLQHLGKPTGNTNGELLFRGKNFYQVQGVQNDFRLDCHERGLLLAVSQGRVQKSNLANDDFEHFRVLGQKLEADIGKSREAPVGGKLSKDCELEA